MREGNNKYWSLILLLIVMTLASCDPHQYADEPDPPLYDVKINLSFELPLPLFQEIDYDNRANQEIDYSHDIRYIVEAYPTVDNKIDKQPYRRFTLSHEIDGTWDRTLTIRLPEGNYDIYVWTDFVDHMSIADKYQDTSDFEHITLLTPHSGNNDYRDCFVGSLKEVFVNPDSSPEYPTNIDIGMVRPSALFKFIATDIALFVDSEIERILSKGLTLEAYNLKYATKADTRDAHDPYIVNGLDLSRYTVRLTYSGYMPTVFDIFYDKPIDSSLGISFEGTITKSDDTYDALLAFDYVFVNGPQSAVQVVLQVFSPDEELVSQTSSIDVPITRSQMTIVKGEFLTQQASGGIGVDPGFEGTFIYHYND